LSDGDFRFFFFINLQEVLFKKGEIERKYIRKDVGNGETTKVNVTRTVTNPSDILKLKVIGHDDDSMEPILWGVEFCSPMDKHDGENSCGEYTSTSKSFDVSPNSAPGPDPEEFATSYQMNAYPKGGDSEVKFRLYGNYKIYYE